MLAMKFLGGGFVCGYCFLAGSKAAKVLTTLGGADTSKPGFLPAFIVSHSLGVCAMTSLVILVLTVCCGAEVSPTIIVAYSVAVINHGWRCFACLDHPDYSSDLH